VSVSSIVFPLLCQPFNILDGEEMQPTRGDCVNTKLAERG